MNGHRRELLRFSWPLALLLASVGVTAVAAFQAQRTVGEHQRTAERLLRDYASFASWSYEHEAQGTLEGAVADALQYVMHGRVLHHDSLHGPVPNAGDLWTYFERNRRYQNRFCSPRACPVIYSPSAYFGFTLGADTLSVAGHTANADRSAWFEQASSEMRRWLADSLNRHVRAEYDPEAKFAVVLSPRIGTGRLLVYTLMPTTRGDTIVYGVEYGSDVARETFRASFEAEPLLPAELMHGGNRDLLGVRVVAGPELGFFESPDWPSSPYIATELFPRHFGGLAVEAAIRPELADDLIIGGLPRSRLPFLIGLLALAAAMSLIAVGQLKREGELVRLRADFVSSVSHELRTPLAQIRLFVETLRLGRVTTDEQRDWTLRNIDRETNRLAHLVENVLHFARTGRPVRPESAVSVDLGDEIREGVRAFEPIAASKRVTLDTALDEGVRVPLQREAFRQVLLNLLDNAVKYGPADQTVTVALRRLGSSARVSVSDQGPGVPAAEREAVWEPFFRGAGERARSVGGSGIGLSIVRDIVSKMGGRVWLEDCPSGGARFVVDLPADPFETDVRVTTPTAPNEELDRRLTPSGV